MKQKTFSKYHFFFYLLGTGAAMLVGIAALGILFRPALPSKARSYDKDLVASVRAMRDVRPPEGSSRLQVPVDYSEGEKAAWYPKKEAPLLRKLVEEGHLPPVEERVGPEPVVLQGPEGIGTYGGTWTRVASSPGDLGVISWRLSASSLFRWSPMGYPLVPHLAKGYHASPDFKTWTIHLRKGIRWSDGHPFTADDLLYWWEEEIGYFQKGIAPKWLKVQGEAGTVERVDEFTVRYSFAHPYPTFLEQLASPHSKPFSPEHYLRPFHPEKGDPELIEAGMKAMGMASKRIFYSRLNNFQNVDMPRMWPWIYRTHRSVTPQSFVRNPYYFAVDPEGNQLPYLDRILFQEKNARLIPLSAAGGDISMQNRHIRFRDYTMLMQQREQNEFELYNWFPSTRSAWTLWPNLNRYVDPDEPVTKYKAELLGKKTFRQALSLAINRQRIIDAEYSGVGEPSQIEPGEYSPFHSRKLKNSFTEYDPERASKMLDSLGLTERDSEGMRTFRDGSRMTWNIDFTDYTGEGPVQFVVDDWAAVGIRATQRERARPLFATEKKVLKHDFTVWSGESEFNPLVQPRSFVPTYSESHFAPGYGQWYNRGGMFAGEKIEGNRFIEPPPGSPVRKAMELLDRAYSEADEATRLELIEQIMDINAEEVWSISISTPPPELVVVKNGFRNVPKVALVGASYNTPGNTGIDTYFIEDPQDSEAAVQAIRNAIIEPTRAPQAIDAETMAVSSTGSSLGKFISRTFIVLLVLALVLVALRHPFIGRRFIIMVPTLLVISIAGFTIIQIPPGSFVESKILELRMTGDEAAIQEVERLVDQFYLDEPVWSQYVRWMGFKWFVTFESKDAGLLQGNLGRSMESGQSVNDVVGDRILLTFCVSLGTVLFTWLTALPIGIYSAVRQYSIGDYLATIFGFIGMCIPNFLLAILLMYWSGEYLGVNVTGLFSIEYAASPEWTWGKFIDLLKHIWVPIVIIGTAGTAGMIRVMRGNLLDELKKPYVTTARAKGVRPVKLLLKYPVRLALNPFISGIGGIFPALVSGGAIVAIVLSLPMVGPLMLQGLMTQDVYLAASMLMTFSILGVMGTLVSDLLLLWIDPRIRMEGGKR